MRKSATLGHSQDRVLCIKNLEVIDPWDLLRRRRRRRLRLLSLGGQETTIWWHTGGVIRNVENALIKKVIEHSVKDC